ncbi:MULTISPECIES: SRPBCC family protein [Brevibacterium]|uniref:SRPBCC family protein n=2 Tax=Brevibacterium TaxID=1696 RepID=A0ABP9U674_9MICO
MATNEKSITVTRVIDHSTQEIFDVLTLPENHEQFDGSDMVRAAEKSQRIMGVGDVFVMNMFSEPMGGDYQMHNHVTAYDANKMVGWQPAQADNPKEPGGWEWLYELNAVGPDSTEVTLTYDWSKVDDPKLLPLFPVVSEEQLDESLNRLAAAVSSR